MSSALEIYNELVESYSDAEASQMFGKLCAKIKGKPFVSFYQDELAFRIGRDITSEWLGTLKDSKLFDPSGKGRPFKDWIQVPLQHQNKYRDLADIALKFTLDNL